MYGNGERGEERVGGGKREGTFRHSRLFLARLNIDVDLSLSVVEHSKHKNICWGPGMSATSSMKSKKTVCNASENISELPYGSNFCLQPI